MALRNSVSNFYSTGPKHNHKLNLSLSRTVNIKSLCYNINKLPTLLHKTTTSISKKSSRTCHSSHSSSSVSVVVDSKVPGNNAPVVDKTQTLEPPLRMTDVPRRIVIFVEPSPFTYVSGYKNRFRSMIKYLVEAGCKVLVVTTGKGFTIPGVDTSGFKEQPSYFEGAEVISSLSMGCPYYPAVPISFALSPRIWRHVRDFQPDLVHCSSPGTMVFAAKLYAALLRVPVVLSYHTHVPSYLPRYGAAWLVAPFWAFLRALHVSAHLTLVTSPAMGEEMQANQAVAPAQIKVWKKGVDSEAFHPRFRSEDARMRLVGGAEIGRSSSSSSISSRGSSSSSSSGGKVNSDKGGNEKPVAVYVGRLGYEKNLFFLKRLFAEHLRGEVALAFIGDGPARAELEREFRGSGVDVRFLGVLHNEALSAAYASADVFVMPSESETLGFVVLEAMASQLPVVAVNAGGIPDIITPALNGVTGFLYDRGNYEAAAAAIRKLVQDPELRRSVGVRARQEVSKWDWKAATEHLLYQQYPIAVRAFRAGRTRSTGTGAGSSESAANDQSATPSFRKSAVLTPAV